MANETEHGFQCVEALKAMSDGTRFAILRFLGDGPKSVTEIAEALKIDQPRVSHHLTILRYASLVRSQREGRKIMYEIAPSIYQGVSKSGKAKILNLGCCTFDLEKVSRVRVR